MRASKLRADAVRSSDVKDGALRLRDFRRTSCRLRPAGPPDLRDRPVRPGRRAPGDLAGTPLGGDLAGALPNPELATQPAVRVEDDTQVALESASAV